MLIEVLRNLELPAAGDARAGADPVSAVTEGGRVGSGGRFPAAQRWLFTAVILLAPLPIFLPSLVTLAESWARPADTVWRALVPVLAAVAAVRIAREAKDRGAPRFRWLGAAGVMLAVGVAVLGDAATLHQLVVLAVILWIASLLTMRFGLPGAFAFWLPVGILLLALPLPSFVAAPVSLALARGAAEAGAALAAQFGAAAAVEGRAVHLAGTLVPLPQAVGILADPFPVLFAAAAVSVFVCRTDRERAVVLALAPILLIGAGALRTALLAVAAGRGGPEALARAAELTGGAAAGLACGALLLAVAALLRRASTRRAAPAAADRAPDLAGGEAGPAPLVAAALVSLTVALTLVLAPAGAGRDVARDPLRHFPPEIGGWSGSFSGLYTATASNLRADDFVNVDYVHPEERAPVNFWVAYYAEQEGRRTGAIHSPEACLPGDGWNILSIERRDLAHGGVRSAIPLNRVIIERDGKRHLVYYWFEGRGRSIASEFRARLLAKADRVGRGRTDGALVRYVTPMLPDEEPSAADARAVRLILATLPALPRFVPE